MHWLNYYFLKTGRVNVFIGGVGKDVLFLNQWTSVGNEEDFNGKKYCSSNLNLIYAQIRHLSARQKCVSREMHKNSILLQTYVYETKHLLFTCSHYINYKC